jgi:hypothetical protein
MSKKLNVKQIEKILMLGLVVVFLFWMARQCARSGNTDEMQPLVTEQNTPATTPAAVNTTTVTATQPIKRDTIIQKEYINRPMPLFIWADGLKVRSEPYLTSSIVVELRLNAEVTYEGEVSPFKQKITLDNVDYDERWLKIKTADGKQGWIYGGGIRLYQK